MNDMEFKMQSLTNRINTAEKRISKTEDTHNADTQLVKQLETSLNKANKMIEEMKDHFRKLNIRIMGLPEGVERESGMQGVLNEIIQENFQNTGNMNPTHIQDKTDRELPTDMTQRDLHPDTWYSSSTPTKTKEES